MSSVEWNWELLTLLAVTLAHAAIPCIIYMRDWSATPLLWTLRFDLLIMCGYALQRVYILYGLGHALTDIDMLHYAALEALLLGLSFLPLPGWLVWSIYGVLMLALSAISVFFLTFKMRLF